MLTNGAPIIRAILDLIRQKGPMGWYLVCRLTSVSQTRRLDDPDYVTSTAFAALKWCAEQGYVTPLVDAGMNSTYGLTHKGRRVLGSLEAQQQ